MMPLLKRLPRIAAAVLSLLPAPVVSRMVPSIHFPRKFRWSASLNSVAGTASSYESSDLPPSICRKNDDNVFGVGVDVDGGSDRRLLEQLGKDMFGSYPRWLVRRRVTFGLFTVRAVLNDEEARSKRIRSHRPKNEAKVEDNENEKDKDEKNITKEKNQKRGRYSRRSSTSSVSMSHEAVAATPYGVAICDSLFGFNLLSFGRDRTSILFDRDNTAEKEKGGRTRRGGTPGAHPRIPRVGERRVVMDFPVIGGLLAYMPAEIDGGGIGVGGGKGGSGGGGGGGCGCVRFALVQRLDGTNGAGGGKEEKKTRYPAETEKGYWRNVSIESEIADGYRPAIAGPAPVSLARKWLYRSTQSLVHAYVMWRYHGWCADYIFSRNDDGGYPV